MSKLFPSIEDSEFLFFKLLMPDDSNRWCVILPFYYSKIINNGDEYRYYVVFYVLKNNCKISNIRRAVSEFSLKSFKFGNLNEITVGAKKSLIDNVFKIDITDEYFVPQ